MNTCAIIYGSSPNDKQTLASLKHVENINIIRCQQLHHIDFSSLNNQYTIFIKSGDVLSTDAARHLQLHIELSEPDILYTNEKIVSALSKEELIFRKPDYSSDMIFSMNYFGSLLCVKTNLLREIQFIESQNDKNVLYEIVLKLLPKSKVITHIDEVLYTHYSDKAFVDYADFFESIDHAAVHKLLEDFCKNNQINASVKDGRYHGTFRIQYEIPNNPLVSIIIPFRDKPKLLKDCIDSILEKSTYRNFEIIGINNGSQEKSTFQLIQRLKDKDSRIQFYDLNVPFNYAVLNNYAANHFAKGEHLLFLNNDTAVISPSWIEAMLEYSQQSGVGVVGAKLLYPDHTIQHCGMICYPRPEHVHRFLPDNEPGYFYFPHIVRNYHIVTFACVMVKTTLFKQVEGLYEKLAVEFNDVDFCARISALGYRNVYTPYAVLYHYESKSRGESTAPEQHLRRQWEFEATMQRTPLVFVRDSFSHEASGDVALRELMAMQSTLSWRITRPLRKWKKWLKSWKR